MNRKAEFESLMYGLHAVSEFMAQLTQLTYDDEYTELYEAVARHSGEGYAS